jgi:hypothetical protein
MQEEFRKIEGYDNYSVSNLGNVRNNKTGRILKASNIKGYYYVKLCKEQTKKIFLVHRLLAVAFIPNPDHKDCVDHIDNNRQNNNAENLRWATCKENSQNTKIRFDNMAGLKGINWHTRFKKWQARITVNGELKHLGYFDNIEDAKQARMKEANKIFGEFTNSCEKIIHINVNININVNQEQLELEELEKELERIINL